MFLSLNELQRILFGLFLNKLRLTGWYSLNCCFKVLTNKDLRQIKLKRKKHKSQTVYGV